VLSLYGDLARATGSCRGDPTSGVILATNAGRVVAHGSVCASWSTRDGRSSSSTIRDRGSTDWCKSRSRRRPARAPGARGPRGTRHGRAALVGGDAPSARLSARPELRRTDLAVPCWRFSRRARTSIFPWFDPPAPIGSRRLVRCRATRNWFRSDTHAARRARRGWPLHPRLGRALAAVEHEGGAFGCVGLALLQERTSFPRRCDGAPRISTCGSTPSDRVASRHDR
jgi:hypothetical protein